MALQQSRTTNGITSGPCLLCLTRYIGESAVAGGHRLWLSPVRRVPLCLLEALLDTMEGGRAFTHHQGGSWAPEPIHEPSAPTARSQAACLHGRGSSVTRPPWVVALRHRHRQRAHSCGVCGVGGGPSDSHIAPTGGHGHTRGSYEDQPHVSRHSAGCSV